MAVEVVKVEIKSVTDASGVAEHIQKGTFTADQVVGVIGGCKYKIINLFNNSIFIEFLVFFEFQL